MIIPLVVFKSTVAVRVGLVDRFPAALRNVRAEGQTLRFHLGAHEVKASVVLYREVLNVFTGGRQTQLLLVDPLAHAGEEQDAHGGLTAPMPGKIVATPAAVGDLVTKGQSVVVLEAMKMEHALVAPFDGTVAEINVSIGAQVSADSVLAVVEPVET